MRLHRAVVWLLRAETLRRGLGDCHDLTADRFRWHWSAGPRGAWGVVWIRYGVTNLVEDVELWLRERIETELRRRHAGGWWSAIPKDIQQRAARRHQLACTEFGARRAGTAQSGSWLSFGDTVKVLDGLDADSWTRCLEATIYCRRSFSRAIRKIKAFRDARIAHVQSGGPTAAEVAKLLGRVAKLCECLRPQDYALTMAGTKVLLSKAVGQHRKELFDAYEPSSRRRPSRVMRLRVLDHVLPPSADGVPRNLDLVYYDALLLCCAEAGGTISQFVGEG